MSNSNGGSLSDIKIFVSNIPSGDTERILIDLFSSYGKVVRCDVLPAFAFVFMKNMEEAKAAIAGLNNHKVGDGGRLTVQLSTKATQGRSSSRYEGPTKIFVGNLARETRKETISDMFETYGTVTQCDIMSEGYAFVRMEKEADAFKAIKGLNGHKLDGHQLTVELSTKSTQRRSARDRDEEYHFNSYPPRHNPYWAPPARRLPPPPTPSTLLPAPPHPSSLPRPGPVSELLNPPMLTPSPQTYLMQRDSGLLREPRPLGPSGSLGGPGLDGSGLVGSGLGGSLSGSSLVSGGSGMRDGLGGSLGGLGGTNGQMSGGLGGSVGPLATTNLSLSAGSAAIGGGGAGGGANAGESFARELLVLYLTNPVKFDAYARDPLVRKSMGLPLDDVGVAPPPAMGARSLGDTGGHNYQFN